MTIFEVREQACADALLRQLQEIQAVEKLARRFAADYDDEMLCQRIAETTGLEREEYLKIYRERSFAQNRVMM